MKKKVKFTEETQKFQDAVNREEIFVILKRLEQVAKYSSGEDLEILKKMLTKITGA